MIIVPLKRVYIPRVTIKPNAQNESSISATRKKADEFPNGMLGSLGFYTLNYLQLISISDQITQLRRSRYRLSMPQSDVMIVIRHIGMADVCKDS